MGSGCVTPHCAILTTKHLRLRFRLPVTSCCDDRHSETSKIRWLAPDCRSSANGFVFRGVFEMSRGGYRYGAGRPAAHAKTSQFLGLDVRSLHRRGLLATGSSFSWTWSRGDETVGTISVSVPESWMVHLDYRRNGDPRHEALRLDHSFCHYGGTRPWFTCPRCGRRVAIVYLGSATGCRQCLRLRYPSQSEDFLSRSWRRTSRILRRLGREAEDTPRRPSGMRRRTYERLCDAWCREEEFRDDALAAFMAERHHLFL